MEVGTDEKDLIVAIVEAQKILASVKKDKKLYTNDSAVYDLLSGMYELYWEQIHGYLVKQNTVAGEQEIRTHIKNILRQKIIDLCVDKTVNSTDLELGGKFAKLTKDYYALVAFRSLEHWALFYEWDFEDKDKVWKFTMKNMKGYFHYANKTIFDRSIRFLSKQMATGTGKSYSDALTIAWILGYDKNARIIKMVGNPSLLDEVFPSISGIMTSKQFAKVFPYFRQFHEMGGRIEDKMFKIYKSADGVFSLVGSSAPLNFSLYSKQTKISGKRTDFLFLDDITQLEDAGNMRQHGKDLNQYHNVWYKRNANEKDFVVFVGGTTYSLYDILSTLKREHSDGGVKPSPFKYTLTNQDETAVFTVVPKLDYETDESTYPEKFPTFMARKLREKDFKTFMAMEQQTPLPPDGTPFYWDNLQLYDSLLPREDGDACYACLDPARSGKNYVAMGIHRKIEVFPNSGVYRHYLVDCIYQLKTMDELYQEIVEKIKKHNIRKLLVEKNTDTSLKALLEKMLGEQGVNFCEIDEIYTYKIKGDKIYNAESLIRNNIVFPAQSLYSNTSQMGKFMEHIVTYSYKENNDYDDSIDCEAMYAEKFTNEKKKLNKAELLYRRKPRYGG